MRFKLLFLSIIIGFSFLGIFFMSVMIHEGYHVLKTDTVQKACLTFGDNNEYASITGIDNTPTPNEETKAYLLQIISSILLIGIVSFSTYKVFK